MGKHFFFARQTQATISVLPVDFGRNIASVSKIEFLKVFDAYAAYVVETFSVQIFFRTEFVSAVPFFCKSL